MKMDKTLKPGIYLIYWDDNGHSVAAVGVMPNGDNWIAPTNWGYPDCGPRTIDSWDRVDRLELITTQHAEDPHGDYDRAMKGISDG